MSATGWQGWDSTRTPSPRIIQAVTTCRDLAGLFAANLRIVVRYGQIPEESGIRPGSSLPSRGRRPKDHDNPAQLACEPARTLFRPCSENTRQRPETAGNDCDPKQPADKRINAGQRTFPLVVAGDGFEPS